MLSWVIGKELGKNSKAGLAESAASPLPLQATRVAIAKVAGKTVSLPETVADDCLEGSSRFLNSSSRHCGIFAR